MRIVLIGYRGSGKTHVGRELARRLGLDFVDVDDATCERFGFDSIAAIWERFGEPAWRQREAEVTRDLCARDQVVIGLGGGTPMIDDAFAALRAADALRVYLHASPDTLHERVRADPKSAASRPHLTTMGGGVEEIRHVLALRGPVYERLADVVIETDGQSVEQIVTAILRHAELESGDPDKTGA